MQSDQTQETPSESIFSAGGPIDRFAPFTALSIRDWLRNLRAAVDRGDRYEVVLAQRMLVGFAKNLRVMGGEDYIAAAEVLEADVGKLVSEHFASGVNGGGRDGQAKVDCD